MHWETPPMRHGHLLTFGWQRLKGALFPPFSPPFPPLFFSSSVNLKDRPCGSAWKIFPPFFRPRGGLSFFPTFCRETKEPIPVLWGRFFSFFFSTGLVSSSLAERFFGEHTPSCSSCWSMIGRPLSISLMLNLPPFQKCFSFPPYPKPRLRRGAPFPGGYSSLPFSACKRNFLRLLRLEAGRLPAAWSFTPLSRGPQPPPLPTGSQ